MAHQAWLATRSALRPVNPQVPGSSPGRGANPIRVRSGKRLAARVGSVDIPRRRPWRSALCGRGQRSSSRIATPFRRLASHRCVRCGSHDVVRRSYHQYDAAARADAACPHDRGASIFAHSANRATMEPVSRGSPRSTTRYGCLALHSTRSPKLLAYCSVDSFCISRRRDPAVRRACAIRLAALKSVVPPGGRG